jgi:uncharacterized protein DUF2513
MKRDMDLMREILFEVEKWPFTGSFDTLAIPNHSEQEISYHVYLLADAGLIEAQPAATIASSAQKWYPKHLTNEGHEFLDAARQDNTWAKAKETVSKSAGTVTLEALKTALNFFMERAITAALKGL